MRRILYFFPDNIGQQTAGNKTRAIYLLKYFKEKGYKVDFASLKHEKVGEDTEHETINFLKENKLADKVFLLPRKPDKKNPVKYFLRYKIWDLLYYLFTYPSKSNIPTFLTLILKHTFENILANAYDYIIISYVQNADLISSKRLTRGAKTIVDTHDFITAQFKEKKDFNLGVTFEDEIKRLNMFDEIWAISGEEQYIFSQFCKSPVRLVPLMIDIAAVSLKPFDEKKYDIIYVASDNIHNKNSSKWFFENVYPLLPTGLKICVIGLINQSIPETFDIERVLFAEDLDAYYNDSKVAICPMLQGTGVKVKVIEAMAFGLPVVCTSRGTDGLPNKKDNGCLVSDVPAEFAANISALLNNWVLYETQSRFSKETFSGSFSQNVVFKILDNAFTD